MIADGLAQNSISYTFAFGALGARLKLDLTKVVTLGVLTRWALLASMAVWYSVIDPPGINDEPHPGAQWAFLFPQLANALPLTHAAKMLLLLQALISVITLTGIAGNAINILAGTASQAA
jgi:hypothetical protein